MDIKTLKLNMEGLWKETFGDSPEYVKLVFDNYFQPELAVWREEEGIVAAALMGVSYWFESLHDIGNRLKGLYLCGLATRPEYRRRGVMSALLEEINSRAHEEGYDFTFLIPAGEGARRYYHDRGYHDSFYRLEEHYVHGHDFESSGTEPHPAVEIKGVGEVVRGRLLDFLHENQFSGLREFGNSENQGNCLFALGHTRRDWEIVVEEALISRNPVYVGLEEERIIGVAFASSGATDTVLTGKKTLEIKKLVCGGKNEEKAFLKGLEAHCPDANISIIRDLDEIMTNPPSPQLWSPFFAQNNPRTAEYEDISEAEEPFDPMVNARPLGMVRILDINSLVKKLGLAESQALKGYSEEELMRLILRRPTMKRDEDTLETLLEIPELALSMSLLLE